MKQDRNNFWSVLTPLKQRARHEKPRRRTISIKTKILKLEQHLLGRSGLPRWATDAAEDLALTIKLHEPGRACLQQELLRLDPNYVPPPPVPPLDVEEYAAELVQRYGTYEKYRGRFSLDHEEGRARQARADATFERLKRMGEESKMNTLKETEANEGGDK